MGVLKIARLDEHTNRLRNIKLFLNNKETGTIANSAIKEFPVEPGRYSLYAKIDWCSSNKVDFEINSNETIKFDLSSFAKGGYPNGFSTLYYLIFRPAQYLILKKADS